MRLFVSIPVPEEVAQALEAVQDALPLGRPSDPDQFHLTLAFLGELRDLEAEAAHEALETLRSASFDIRLATLEPVERDDGRMIWAVPSDPAPLADLAARVRSRLTGAGLVLERRRFRPHVTLVHLSREESSREVELAKFLSRWSAPPVPAFAPGHVALVQSIQTKAGYHHEPLAEYPLSPPPLR